MTAKVLLDALKRVETRPAAVQAELAGIAHEIDAVLTDDAYVPTAEQLAGVDRGLTAVERTQFVAAHDVEAAIAKHRPPQSLSTHRPIRNTATASNLADHRN